VTVDFEVRRGGVARLAPEGVFWFGSAPSLQEALLNLLTAYPEAKRLQIDLSGLGRIDYSSAITLREVVEEARAAGLEVDLIEVPDHAHRILTAVWGEEMEQILA
jgi:ABC-type transporter Mla MlaB component